MDKRETVIEYIKKILALGGSDSEVADALYDVGISKDDAMELIKQAKGIAQAPSQSASPSTASGPQEKTASALDDSADDLSMNDQIVQQIPIAKSQNPSGAKNQQSSQTTAADKLMNSIAQTSDEDEEEELDEIQASMDKETEPEVATDVDAEIEKLQKKVNASQSQKIIPQNPLAPAQNALAKKVSSFSVSPVQNIPSDNSADDIEPDLFSEAPAEVIPKMNFNLSAQKKPSVSLDSSPDFEELWKKGIVVAVNAKLAEMKRLKDDIDAQIREKVDEAVRKELYQYKVLIDSQKELLISSNKEALEQKQKEIVFIIDSKIAELKQYNKQLSDNLASIEASRKQQEASMQQIAQALEDAKRSKSQMVIELNSEMIKSKSQAQAFLDQSSIHLSQIDERVNKALELEKNIAEGMLSQAEQKIEQLTIQRADELIAQLQVELNRMQSISKKLSPEMLEQKIQVLDEFKKQFLTSMQQNLAQINSAIEQLNQKNISADQALSEKTLAIDAKLEELTKFEKQFTESLEKKLNK